MKDSLPKVRAAIAGLKKADEPHDSEWNRAINAALECIRRPRCIGYVDSQRDPGKCMRCGSDAAQHPSQKGNR